MRIYQGSAPMEATTRKPPTNFHHLTYTIKQSDNKEHPFPRIVPNFTAVILAKSTNVGIIYISGLEVDEDALPLSAGDVYNNYWVDDLQSLFVYGTAGDKIIISWQGY